MIFDAPNKVELIELKKTNAGLDFDWDDKRYKLEQGSPPLVDGVELVKNWLNQCIRTRPGEYGAYPPDYGCSALDLIGHKIPAGEGLATIESEMHLSAKYCDLISTVGNFTFDGEKITAEVTMKDGNEEVITIGA